MQCLHFCSLHRVHTVAITALMPAATKNNPHTTSESSILMNVYIK